MIKVPKKTKMQQMAGSSRANDRWKINPIENEGSSTARTAIE
jgi:hypothetical protein